MTLNYNETLNSYELCFDGVKLKDIHFVLYTSSQVLNSADAHLVETMSDELMDETGEGTIYSYKYVWPANDVEVMYHIFVYERIPCTSIYAEITNKGKETVYLKELKLLNIEGSNVKLGQGVKDWAILKQGNRKNELVSVYQPCNQQFDITDVTAEGNEDASFTVKGGKSETVPIKSDYLTVLQSLSTKQSLLAGFYTLIDQFSSITIVLSSDQNELVSLSATCEFDNIPLQPSEQVCSEKLLLSFQESFVAIDNYAGLSAKVNNARPQQNKVPTGWCSWYFFYESVTENDVLANLEFIYKNNLPLEYIQIDDSWEEKLGEWHPNHKFPHGMKWLADEIHAKGYKAGIWLAPFWVEPKSEIHRDHPEWLLKDDQGDLITFYCHIDGYVIDTSIPEACQWVTDNFRRVTAKWGFDYVKIDFLRAVAMYKNAKFKNPVTRAQALRLGMEAVREGVGPDTFILACGGHYGPTLGIADGNRTSNDIGSDWDKLRFTFKKNLLRYWMNGTWWHNDPDCLLLRGPDEGTPGNQTGAKHKTGSFTDVEVDTILTLFRATGGMVVLGDDLTQLKLDKINKMKHFIQSDGIAAIPRDMFNSRFPYILHRPLKDNLHEVALINWFDEPLLEKWTISQLIAKKIEDKEILVTEYWTKQEFTLESSSEQMPLEPIQPHGCYLLTIKVKE